MGGGGQPRVRRGSLPVPRPCASLSTGKRRLCGLPLPGPGGESAPSTRAVTAARRTRRSPVGRTSGLATAKPSRVIAFSFLLPSFTFRRRFPSLWVDATPRLRNLRTFFFPPRRRRSPNFVSPPTSAALGVHFCRVSDFFPRRLPLYLLIPRRPLAGTSPVSSVSLRPIEVSAR